jgi:C4-dicarboxylate-specific signal transduction histidine kinase
MLIIVAVLFKPPGDLTPAYINRAAIIALVWAALLFVRYNEDVDSRNRAAIASEKRRLEDSRREEARRRQELEAIMDTVPATLWITRDPECKRITGNRATSQLLGTPNDATVPLPSPGQGLNGYLIFRDGGAVPTDELPVQTACRTGEPVVGLEYELRFGDGRSVWLYGNATPLKDGEGGTIGAIGAFIDVTERHEDEDELRRSNDELQQFAYIASHDLQEPLRMVLSYLALLNRKFGDDLNPKAKEYMSTAVEGAERMRQLVDDLLQFSRVESKGREIVGVDMNKAVEAVLTDLQVAVTKAEAQVTVGPLPTVLADDTQMKQLLTNLISNAIKFRGAHKPLIEVSATESPANWTFAVRDNGIGIDPHYIDKLFHMFQRLHTKDEYPGTGIGLAISKKIVERHGGRIWVDSEPGKGSTFYFTLPNGSIQSLRNEQMNGRRKRL